MNLSRRSFLTMLGVSSVAAALPAIPGMDATQRARVRFSQRRREEMLQAVTGMVSYLVLTDTQGREVGPVFPIPADWWAVRGGVAALRNAITVHDWDGPACTLDGFKLKDASGSELGRAHDAFNAQCISSGDAIKIYALTVTA